MPVGPVGADYDLYDDGYGTGGPPTDGGTGGGTSPGGGSPRNLWLAIAGVFIVGAVIGVAIALASSNDKKEDAEKDKPAASTTTSSSSTTSTSVPASTTTTTPGPVITSFTANPSSPVSCGGPVSVTFSWTTQ